MGLATLTVVNSEDLQSKYVGLEDSVDQHFDQLHILLIYYIHVTYPGGGKNT